jgi:hypothetical protein
MSGDRIGGGIGDIAASLAGCSVKRLLPRLARGGISANGPPRVRTLPVCHLSLRVRASELEESWKLTKKQFGI